MRVFFYLLGSKGFLVLSEFIKKNGWDSIEGVAIGRDEGVNNDYHNEIYDLCNNFSIRIFDESDLPAVEHEVEKLDLSFAIGWKKIIVTKSPLVVLHDSLLPKNRGFAPLVGSLIAGENEIGVTALLATDEYDKGDILTQLITEIEYPIKINEAIAKVEPLYAKAVCDVYKIYLENGELKGSSQEDSKATYSLWLDNQDYFIDWSWPSDKIKRFIDAVGSPYAGARTRLKDEVVKIIEAEVVPDVIVRERRRHIGKIIFKDELSFTVICGTGLLRVFEINNIQNEPKKITFRSRFY